MTDEVRPDAWEKLADLLERESGLAAGAILADTLLRVTPYKLDLALALARGQLNGADDSPDQRR